MTWAKEFKDKLYKQHGGAIVNFRRTKTMIDYTCRDCDEEAMFPIRQSMLGHYYKDWFFDGDVCRQLSRAQRKRYVGL